MRNLETMIVAIGLAWMCGPLSAQELSRPLTLQEAVELALARYPEVKLAEEQLVEVQGKIREVRAEALPQASLEGYGLRLRDPSILNSSSFDKVPPEFREALKPSAANLFEVGATIKQPIYTAGKLRAAIKLAEVGASEKEAGIDVARQQVAFKVFKAFHDLLLTDENLLVLQETKRQRAQQLEVARNRHSQGVATEIDVLRSEVNLANLEPALIRAENSIRMARSVLNSLIMTDIESPTVVDGKLEHRPVPLADLAQIQQQALEARPELIVARRQVEEARLILKLAHAQNRLSVDMDARFGYSARDPYDFFRYNYSRWQINFNFRLPVYDSGRKAGQIIQAQARLRSAEQGAAHLENSVRLEVKSAYDDMKSSARAIDAARLSVTQAERVLKMMQANYQYGAATTLDVQDSQTALLVARHALLNATHGYEIAKAQLRLAKGSPILEQEADAK